MKAERETIPFFRLQLTDGAYIIALKTGGVFFAESVPGISLHICWRWEVFGECQEKWGRAAWMAEGNLLQAGWRSVQITTAGIFRKAKAERLKRCVFFPPPLIVRSGH